MKTLNQALKYGAAVALSAVSGVSMAAVPAGVDKAITTAQTDAVTVGGYIIVALAALVAIKWITKGVRGA